MRRAHRDHPTVIDDANPVRILGLRKLVSGQADRDVELRSQLADVLPKVAPAGGIEAAGRLIEEQNLRVMHEPADDLELPAHAARQSPDRLENLGAETNYIGELSDLAPIRGRHQAVHRAVWVQPVKDGVESDVLLAVEVHIQGRVLKDDSDLAPHLARLTNDVVSRDLDRAGSQAEGCREDRDRGRLPSSIGTEEGEELPLLYLEADTIDGVRSALSIPLDQVANLNRRRHIFGRAYRSGTQDPYASAATADHWITGDRTPAHRGFPFGSVKRRRPTSRPLSNESSKTQGGIASSHNLARRNSVKLLASSSVPQER